MSLPKYLTEEVDKLVKKLTNKNKEKIIKDIHKLIESKKYSERTQTVNYSKIKKIFKQHTKDEDFLKQIKPKNNITEKILKENIERRNTKKRNIINKELIEKVLNLYNSNNIFELAIFLLLTSGRRTTELIESKITNKKKSKNLIIDKVKKRTDNKENIELQVLVPKTTFMKVLNEFKKRYKYTNKHTFVRTLNRKIKRLLGNDIHAHTLRKIYANYLYQFRNRQNLAINPFIQNVLSQMHVSSSLAYADTKIDFDDDFIKKKKFK